MPNQAGESCQPKPEKDCSWHCPRPVLVYECLRPVVDSRRSSLTCKKHTSITKYFLNDHHKLKAKYYKQCPVPLYKGIQWNGKETPRTKPLDTYEMITNCSIHTNFLNMPRLQISMDHTRENMGSIHNHGCITKICGGMASYYGYGF